MFLIALLCAAREGRVSEQPKMIMRQLLHIIILTNNFRLTCYWVFFHPLFFFFQAECQNHIRIVAKMSEEVLLLCGTHAYKPKCRHYAFKVGQTARHNEAKKKSQKFQKCADYVVKKISERPFFIYLCYLKKFSESKNERAKNKETEVWSTQSSVFNWISKHARTRMWVSWHQLTYVM